MRDTRAESSRYITSDPDIFGGEPIVKDTRLLVHGIAQRLDGGDTIERLCEEHPHVPAAAFAAAYAFAKSTPPRKRAARPWR